MKSNLEILTESFSKLDDEELDNLAWHLENKTPFFCGPGSDRAYVSKKTGHV